MRQIARLREHFPLTLRRTGLLRAGGVALLALAVVAIGFAIGLRAGEGQQPDPSGDLRALLDRAGGAVVYSEFGKDADVIWAADPGDPSDRVALGAAPHAANFGVQASLSPNGEYVAYAGARSSSSADLWLLDVGDGTTTLLTANVDLAAPVWASAGDAVVASRSAGGETNPTSELLRIDLKGNVTTLAAAAGALYPIESSPDGELYFASLDATGTDLSVIDEGGAREVAHLSDGIARDWDVSPDGTQLAYLAPRASGGFAANVLDLEGGESGGIASQDGPAFNPIWSPGGGLTVGRLGRTLDSKGIAGSSSEGFDVPLSWSPNGAYLIVRHFEGTSGADPGPSWLWTIANDGQRHRLSDLSDVAIVGWLDAAP